MSETMKREIGSVDEREGATVRVSGGISGNFTQGASATYGFQMEVAGVGEAALGRRKICFIGSKSRTPPVDGTCYIKFGL
jgi:hypothetical protein